MIPGVEVRDKTNLMGLPLHWLVFLSRMALVDTIFPYLQKTREKLSLLILTGPFGSPGVFRTNSCRSVAARQFAKVAQMSEAIGNQESLGVNNIMFMADFK